jgi:phosphoribosyl 1,2-cyclic phosphodiesterase
VRGSLPVPGPDTIRYGGNTSCVEVRFGDRLLILDAGTGVRRLGLELQRQAAGRPISAAILLSHFHWDHIQGLPFFGPIFVPGNRFQVYGCSRGPTALESVLAGQMESPYSPLPMSALPGTLEFTELGDQPIEIDGIRVTTTLLNHPGLALAFRLEAGGKSLVYATDNEPCPPRGTAADPQSPCLRGDHEAILARFAGGADLLISDAQYTPEEYAKHVGWGHSSIHDALRLGVTAGVKRLALFHHDPERSDEQIDALVDVCRAELDRTGVSMECFAAKEGLTVEL